METPKKKMFPAKVSEVVQLTSGELDHMRREAKQDGAWAKLQLGSHEENPRSVERLDVHPEACPAVTRATSSQQLDELKARFDRQLASLNAPQAHQALNAFMNEPLRGKAYRPL